MARLGTHATQSSDDPDYSRLSLDDLQALQARMAHEIEARRTADQDQVKEQIRALAAGAGLTVTFNQGRPRKARGAAAKKP